MLASQSLPPSRVIEVNDLSVTFRAGPKLVEAVKHLSFTVDRGETVAIVGESGSGKSVTALSLMRLVEHGGGRIVVGQHRVRAPRRRSRRPRAGASHATMRDDPRRRDRDDLPGADDIAESGVHRRRPDRRSRSALHQRKDVAARRAPRRCACSSRCAFPRRGACSTRYPHQLSGGMRQRVMIAMALSCKPALLIADEPTTALDVTIQAQILDADPRCLQDEMHMAVMFITHDMGVVAEVADRVVVMYRGEKVEEGTADADLPRAASIRTRARCSPPCRRSARCAAPTCPRKFRRWRRHGTRRIRSRRRSAAGAACPPSGAGAPLLRVRGLTTRFPVRERHLRPRAAARARGRAGELRSARRRDAGAGRRIGLRQVDHRPLAAAARRHRQAAASSSTAATSRKLSAGRSCGRCAATSR